MSHTARYMLWRISFLECRGHEISDEMYYLWSCRVREDAAWLIGQDA